MLTLDSRNIYNGLTFAWMSCANSSPFPPKDTRLPDCAGCDRVKDWLCSETPCAWGGLTSGSPWKCITCTCELWTPCTAAGASTVDGACTAGCGAVLWSTFSGILGPAGNPWAGCVAWGSCGPTRIATAWGTATWDPACNANGATPGTPGLKEAFCNWAAGTPANLKGSMSDATRNPNDMRLIRALAVIIDHTFTSPKLETLAIVGMLPCTYHHLRWCRREIYGFHLPKSLALKLTGIHLVSPLSRCFSSFSIWTVCVSFEPHGSSILWDPVQRQCRMGHWWGAGCSTRRGSTRMKCGGGSNQGPWRVRGKSKKAMIKVWHDDDDDDHDDDDDAAGDGGGGGDDDDDDSDDDDDETNNHHCQYHDDAGSDEEGQERVWLNMMPICIFRPCTWIVGTSPIFAQGSRHRFEVGNVLDDYGYYVMFCRNNNATWYTYNILQHFLYWLEPSQSLLILLTIGWEQHVTCWLSVRLITFNYSRSSSPDLFPCECLLTYTYLNEKRSWYIMMTETRNMICVIKTCMEVSITGGPQNRI